MSNGENQSQTRIQLSGLWKQESKTGKVFYSGNLGGVQLQLWPNTYKEEGDNRPNMILYVVQRPRKPKPTEPHETTDTGDEVPF